MKVLSIIFIFFLISCTSESNKEVKKPSITAKKYFTDYSKGDGYYINFNSGDAINKIADIENEHFNNIEEGVSKYYGTVWRQSAEQIFLNNSISQYEDYLNKLDGLMPDSLHCTLYAYEALKAGLNEEQLNTLETTHREIWKTREIAGWSIGYILVKHFDWEAFLIINPNSHEYQHCLKSFQKDKTYPVWKQPNIPLVDVYTIGDQDSLITDLLSQNEFSWGFSEQGIHTWITRYNSLKECNWSGTPSKEYEKYEFEKPLFIETVFNEYSDYDSHVLIFPKKENTASDQ